MELRDSRRLTGPNFIWLKPGAVLDLLLDDDELEAGPSGSASTASLVANAWSGAARQMLDALGWQAEELGHKRVRTAREGSVGHGMSLALSAPLDGLYASCSIAEWALQVAVGQDEEGFDAARARLAAEIAEEANPGLLALRDGALEHGVAFLSCDDFVSVGMGAGSMTWVVDTLPAVGDVDWSGVHDVPHCVVTGTNGKSTTVRLLSTMATCAGMIPGTSSTDSVRVGEQVLDAGDWSGPGGGRMLLRDKRVTMGLLETARGGMMRRGLALERTDLAVVLNVGNDHFGDWGTPDLKSMADAKLIPVRAAKWAVLNADDPELVAAFEAGLGGGAQPIWFSLDGGNPVLGAALERGLGGAWFADGALWLAPREVDLGLGLEATKAPATVESSSDLLDGNRGSDPASTYPPIPVRDAMRTVSVTRVADVCDVPMTLGGAAMYNVANALAAILAASEMGLSVDAIRSGLRSFESNAADNPGRLNRFDIGGVTALVDFAHNPDGVAAVVNAAAKMPAMRRLVMLGQAGDRDLESTRGMVVAIANAGIDFVVIKELPKNLRGRELGEIPAEIESELRACGYDETRFSHAPTELEGARAALAWAQPGDLVVLLAHEQRDEVLALVSV